MATVNLLEQRSLAAAVDNIALVTPQLFLLRTFFPTVEDHLTNKIDIETLTGTDRLAVYVGKDEQSKQVQTTPQAVKTFTLPKTDEHKFFLSEDLYLTKTHGVGGIYVNGSPQLVQNRNEKIARAAADLVDRVRRRMEWAAARALTTGKIEYTGDSTSFLLDFGFTNAHRTTLTGTARWGESAADPLAALRAAKKAVQKRTGVTPTMVVMGSAAAAAFIADETVRVRLDGNLARWGSLDLTTAADGGADFLGTILGMRIFEFTQSYTDISGATAEMWPENLVVVAAESRNRRIHRAPIFWEEEGIQTGEFATRQMPKKRPDGRLIEVASSALPIIHDPDSLQLLTVMAA